MEDFQRFFGIFLGFLRLREDFSGSCVDFFLPVLNVWRQRFGDSSGFRRFDGGFLGILRDF